MKLKYAYGVAGILAVVAIGAILFFSHCSPIPVQENQKGSHGFRIWSGPTLRSFAHGFTSTCIPPGWEAVGAVSSGPGWAKYQNGMTGVVIDPTAFASTTLAFKNSAYRVALLYPKTTDPTLLPAFEASITNAFERTGKEFNDSSENPARTHTVVITAGLGAGPEEPDAVYPDPGPNVSFFILPPGSERGEEFMIHAIAHLYNRHRTDLSGYELSQDPLPRGNWQELEATWAETAFRTSDAGRMARLHYLYNVHTAVQTDDFSLITQYPFNDKDAFERIHHTVLIGNDPPFLDDQYGFYVLTPLSIIATEGLLQKYHTGTDLEAIFTEIHEGKITNFFDELSKLLPPDEVTNIKEWMFKGKTIPHDLVIAGGEYYNAKNAQK